MVSPRGDAVPPPARLPRAGGGGAAGGTTGRMARPARRGRGAHRRSGRSGRCQGRAAADGDPVPPTDLRAGAAHGRRAPTRARAAHRACRAGVRRARPHQRGPRRWRNDERRPCHRRVGTGRQARSRAPGGGAGRRLRHRLRLPSIPAAPRRRAGPDERPARSVQPLPGLPGHRVPPRQRRLLHPHRPLQRRPRARRAPPPKRLRRRHPRHPRPRRLDRSDPGAPLHPWCSRPPPARSRWRSCRCRPSRSRGGDAG